jgi:hypothetical protein
MKNEHNYWVNGFWFDMYDEARRYADFIMETQRRYYAIFTRSEIEAYGEEKLKGEGKTSTDQ